MKHFILFSVLFLVSFVVLQLLYGYFLTLSYTPDITTAWSQVENVSNRVAITGVSSFAPLLMIAILAFVITSFTSNIWMKKKSEDF